MDRLNQLRGDAGPSRDSTLEASSLLGDAYMTANDSSKYFSISEVDSSTTVSPSKEMEDEVTANSSMSHAERIISNLSPIPKKSELNSFKIGEQIEAANILSGGVNIFDDNENSYDGDELVIDDAVAEDDKSGETKSTENAEVSFEKTDRIADTSMEEAEAAIPTKDTEVVLQIDGKNVDAIDIGNGLYLYRKDGEEELAAVQILEDNQHQPDIKFLKVRENAEGNLEVYEEIEIEVPKEVPTKEGKNVKNNSQIPVKDVNKGSGSTSNKVAENETQITPKDAIVSEVELDLNKDNAHLESRTEVNLNGKMMKFSESRKSPVIGTFTPMTYHSTPNKEGIPLTKTMVDLQLHPSRHSENVKKTIEVHTDNCKQRLLETPTKNAKDSNENNKNLELVSSSSFHKESSSGVIIDEADQSNQVKNKKSTVVKNNRDEIIPLNVNQDKKMDNKIGNQHTTIIDKDHAEKNVKGNITELSDIIMFNTSSDKSSVSPSPETKPFNEEVGSKGSMIKTPIVETCSKINNEINVSKSFDEIKDGLRVQSAEESNKCLEHVDGKVNVDMTIEKDSIEKDKKNFNTNNSDKDIIKNKEKNDTNIITENQNKNNVDTSNTTVSNTIKSENPVITNTTVTYSTERNENVKLSQTDLEIKEGNETKALQITPKLNPNQEVERFNKALDTLSSSIKYGKLVTTTEKRISENQPIETLKSSSEDLKIRLNTVSEDTSEKESNKKSKSLLENSGITYGKIESAEMNPDATLVPPAEKSDKLSIEKQLKTVSELKQQDNGCKKNLSEATEREGNKDLNLMKRDSKRFEIDNELSTNLKRDKIIDVKGIETENKKKPVKLSKGLLKKVDPKCNQPEITSKMYIDVSKSGSNAECKSFYKDSQTIEKNCSRNSSLEANPSTVEKGEIQKKNEDNQKASIQKNNKISLLSSDLKVTYAVHNLPNEVEHSKGDTKKESAKISKISIPKPINNNKTAVPFGKWTEANRQEFLNKIKESKVPINTSNTKQLKQPNDLNRRDVLQKIDSQRQSSIASTKVQDLNKIKLKHETTAFVSKSTITSKEKLKHDNVTPSISKTEESVSINPIENIIGPDKKESKEHLLPAVPVDMSSTALNIKKDSVQRKEINNQDLIDKTIEGIINRAVTTKLASEDVKQETELAEKQNTKPYTPVSLDEIESKMNELHGIPFVERPPHELPKVFEHDTKNVTQDIPTARKDCKLPGSLPFTNKSQQKNERKQSGTTKINEESDEEIIEHEPVTGDKELNKNNTFVHGLVKEKIYPQESIDTKGNSESKKEPIITENDFDKFARRNSITYENCLTVNFDGKEHHNVIQTVIEKETVPKKLSRNEIMLAESKAKSHKQLAVRHVNFSSKIPTTTKVIQDEDSYSKNYQSKVQIAYQSVMSTKRQQECPITIIEDKPVKVVFMDGNHEYIPHQLNVQGKELSPPKKSTTEWDHFTHSNSESLDSDILDAGNDSKSQDDIKFKSKHQRKQVLTPVEAPELELIEPGDLGIEVSPKKKRKVEDNKSEKNLKSLVPKKSYLLNRNIQTNDASSNSQDLTKTPLKESVNQQDVFVKHSDPISAIDNLVKAAELLETQSERKNDLPHTDQNSFTQQSSPIKRGRGRPRKYPLPESGSDKSSSPVKTPTPQKKPRLIDAKILKHETESDDDERNSDGELVKENWTMGKINENIICPICNKLFRSENVVFKHVKHCTGPSPSRSDSDKRSPRRMRNSQELDWKSEGSKSDSMDIDEDYEINKSRKKRRSKEKRSSIDEKPDDKTEVIVIDDTPIKDRDSPIRKRERLKHDQNKTLINAKVHHGSSNNSLVCEFCGKTFRQLSYLVNHRLQHKSTETKKTENDVHKSLFSCEICKKDFRKLHHLVQHRNIHNPNQMRSSRKSSSEQNDNRTTKDTARVTEDQSAGFRCEPCDKSFRKLHHLVEHRETHDEINKKCSSVTNNIVETTKPSALHHCDICKKTFKKLQHLIEHKEHHLDTGSEKSDDKSVKSSLSTKDIIHECPLCYMVFPNEHSLNKHHIICQRKKKQSAAKQAKQIEANDTPNIEDESKTTESGEENLLVNKQEIKDDNNSSSIVILDETSVISEKQESNIIEVAKPLEQKKEVELDDDIKHTEVNLPLNPEIDKKIEVKEKHIKYANKKEGHERNADKTPVKSKKYVISATTHPENIPDTTTSKKKVHAKDKIAVTVTKRHKTTNASIPVVNKVKTPDLSDDDEVRYMLNPDFQIEETNEGKLFMKVRAKKRNSLQIERPNSKDLMKRRISLQHPPKIPRLKVKPIPRKPINTNTVVKSSRATIAPPESLQSTDSDDSDVKYSFPEPVMKELEKEAQKKDKKQKVIEKRKSLTNIAKRKSLGKIVGAKQKVNSSPAKQIKKRTADAEHRCDCGQLFSSAALLMRHTSLAHTPPRIRRRRSPPPDNDARPALKRTEKSQVTKKTIDPAPKKTGVTTRKSSINSEVKAIPETRKTPKNLSITKTRRSAPHKGVPVPEKMRKLMDKSKK